MNEMQINQPGLPVHLQKELDRQLARVSQIGQVVFAALEGVGAIHRFAVFQAISTSTTVSFLKKAAEMNGMTPELDAHLKQLEQGYFNMMKQIPQEAYGKIIVTLKEVQVEKNEVGWFEELKMSFQRLLES
jgi:hypothetical protein